MNSEWHRQRRAAIDAQAASKPQAAQAKRRSPERWGTLNELVDTQMKGLSRAELTVWMVVFRDVRNGVARTAISDMARRAGITERHAKRAVKTLVEKKLLQIVKRGNVMGIPSSYRVSSCPT